MAEPYILLWLEAPLQAWGASSKFGMRDTLPFPTKSGILGLICCALGAGGEQRELLGEFADLDMQTIFYHRLDKKGTPLPSQTLLRDFQMVGSGYDSSDPWQRLLIPKTIAGKPAVGGGAKLTYRNYLQDSVFAVLLQVPRHKQMKISEHLQNPIWDLYLGRKNCVPTEFIFQGCYEQQEGAWQKADKLAKEKNLKASLFVLQGEHDGEELLTLNDVPLQFGSQKQYRDRLVSLVPAKEGQQHP